MVGLGMGGRGYLRVEAVAHDDGHPLDRRDRHGRGNRAALRVREDRPAVCRAGGRRCRDAAARGERGSAAYDRAALPTGLDERPHPPTAQDRRALASGLVSHRGACADERPAPPTAGVRWVAHLGLELGGGGTAALAAGHLPQRGLALHLRLPLGYERLEARVDRRLHTREAPRLSRAGAPRLSRAGTPRLSRAGVLRQGKRGHAQGAGGVSVACLGVGDGLAQLVC